MFPIETISARMLDYYVGRNDALIIDLREEKAYAESHVRGAVNIPYETLENRKDLPMNNNIFSFLPYHGYREITRFHYLSPLTRFLPRYAVNPPITERVLYPRLTNSLAAAMLAPPLSQ